MTRLSKTAAFTDIHWGCKANSRLHNEDCLRYIEWFCEQVKKDPEIDNIIFLGDWFENRSAINISTLKYAYKGAKMISDLGLPVYFIVGNHDLYYRHSREIHSSINYSEFDNFNIIDEPTVIEELGDGGSLISPYLFPDEYADLHKYKKLKTWWGHFEFKGFVITGYNVIMPTGPDAAEFDGPLHIMSGHFHKRQANGNVVFIGNTFPTNFGDAGDNGRGMMTYDHFKDVIEFEDWLDCPTYIKTTLSRILEDVEQRKEILRSQARVKCVVDIPINFEESTYLREKFMEEYSLREFSMEESIEMRQVLSDTESDIDWDTEELTSVNDLVLRMLTDIDTPHIDNEMLISIYNNLVPK